MPRERKARPATTTAAKRKEPEKDTGVTLEEEESSEQLNEDPPLKKRKVDLTQPQPDAEMFICKKGPNEGLRYWATRPAEGKGEFLGWIDTPRVDFQGATASLQALVTQQGARIAALEAQIVKLSGEVEKLKSE